jgi:hypothetical protein
MHSVLISEGRTVRSIEETRAHPGETADAYRARLASALRATAAEVAWLCVPPGDHLPAMVEALLDARMHAVIEQPWLCTAEQTHAWNARSQSTSHLIGVHYEYCLLDALEAWRHVFSSDTGLQFNGVFQHGRSSHLGLLAMDVLGAHLLSMRQFAVSHSTLGRIDCGYEHADERRVWLTQSVHTLASADFLETREPLIQRYIVRFEAALEGAAFPWGLEFALLVAAEATVLKQKLALAVEPS